jgi:hypothetical protein
LVDVVLIDFAARGLGRRLRWAWWWRRWRRRKA